MVCMKVLSLTTNIVQILPFTEVTVLLLTVRNGKQIKKKY